MKRDSKLSSVLHVLLHMAYSAGPLTSDELAGFLDTNPVVVRRVLAGLRDMGYVDSLKGHGGGWSISCDLATLTLRDVYEAVGSPDVFAIGNRDEMPSCLVEQAVNHALDEALDEARALLLDRLGRVSIADLSADFNERLSRTPRGTAHEHRHRNEPV